MSKLMFVIRAHICFLFLNAMCCAEKEVVTAPGVGLVEIDKLTTSRLLDQGADGQLLLYEGTSLWRYTVDVSRDEHRVRNTAPAGKNTLRVLDGTHSKTIGTLTCSECYTARFTPSGNEVYYSEPHRVDGKTIRSATLWSINSRETKSCMPLTSGLSLRNYYHRSGVY